MSASPTARQAAGAKAIPIKKVTISDPSELPAHYSSTPGGTLFSTTPGGSKIVYEKSFIMSLRNSPSSQTPPSYDIPEILIKGYKSPEKPINYYCDFIKPSFSASRKPSNDKENDDLEDQFKLEL